MTAAVVVAPHPDDEVLGCTAVLRDAPATVIHVTDGVPPWTPTEERDGLQAGRQSECLRAWRSLAARVDSVRLGFGDLEAWQAVGDVAESLAGVLESLGPASVYVPAYQRGHPDHDATYLAGALARDRLGDHPGLNWRVYGLYGFDPARRLRFGWLPAETYGPVEVRGAEPAALEAKARALRDFTTQVWPDSLLDLWLQSPTAEQFAPLPADWNRLPDLACFYDEELDFGRYGASAADVGQAFQRALAAGAR